MSKHETAEEIKKRQIQIQCPNPKCSNTVTSHKQLSKCPRCAWGRCPACGPPAGELCSRCITEKNELAKDAEAARKRNAGRVWLAPGGSGYPTVIYNAPSGDVEAMRRLKANTGSPDPIEGRKSPPVSHSQIKSKKRPAPAASPVAVVKSKKRPNFPQKELFK